MKLPIGERFHREPRSDLGPLVVGWSKGFGDDAMDFGGRFGVFGFRSIRHRELEPACPKEFVSGHTDRQGAAVSRH